MNKKSILGIFANVAIKALIIFLGLYTQRWLNTNLDTETLKNFNLIIPFVAIIMIFLNFGIPITLQKFYTNTKEKLDQVWTTFLALRFATYFVGLALILISFKLSGTDWLGYIIAIFSTQFILTIDQSYFGIASSRGIAWKFSMTDFIGKSTLLTLLFSYPFFKNQIEPIDYFVIVSGASYLLSFILDVVWFKQYTRLGRVDFSILKKAIKPLALLTASSVIVGLYQHTPRLFLEHLGQGSDINGYANANRIVEQALFVIAIVIPQLASFVKIELDRTKESIKTLFKWSGLTLLFGGAFSLGILLLGPFVLDLMNSDKFPVAYDILPILGIFVIFNSLAALFMYLTVFFNKEKYDLVAVVAQLIISIGLYLILIPVLGGVGAAIAVVIVGFVDAFLLRLPLLVRVVKKTH